MNNFLARALSSINALVAIFIIAASCLGGGASAAMHGGSSMYAVGLVIGAIVGIIIAALVCGTIALLVMIERHLSVLAALARRA